MAVPKRKTTPSVRNARRSHDGLRSGAVQECGHCGEKVAPHHLCSHCGRYRERQIVSGQGAKA